MKRPNFKNLKTELTNQDVINLHSVLNTVKGLQGTKLVYAVGRTIDKLNPVVAAMAQDKCIPKQKAFKEYEKELQDLHVKYSKGKYRKTEGGAVHVFPWDEGGAEKEHKSWMDERMKLEDKFKDAIEERMQQGQDYDEFLFEPFPEKLDDFIHKIQEDELDKCVVPEEMRQVIGLLVNYKQKK